MNPLPHPVGQKVVCVDDNFHLAVFEFYRRIPVKNGVYTISKVTWAGQYVTGHQGLSFYLTELPPIGLGASFSAYHFRLLEDEKIVRSRQRRKPVSRKAPAASTSHG